MPITIGEATGRLEEGQRALDEALAGLTDEQIRRPATLGEGDWSVKDLIDHIASWERRALEVFDAAAHAAPFEVLIGIRSVDVLNERNVAASRSRSLRDVRRDAQATHRELIAEVAGQTVPGWRSLVTMSTGRRHQLGTLVGSTTAGPSGPFMHVWAHLPDVHAYLAELRR
jgi:hypothetical protein